MPKDASTGIGAGLLPRLAWPLSMLFHAVAVLALASLSTAVNVSETCLPIVTDAPAVALSVVSPAVEEPPPEPNAPETLPAPDPPDPIQTSLVAELAERLYTGLAALTRPIDNDKPVSDLPSPPPAPSLPRDADKAPSSDRNTDIDFTADFRLIRARAHPHQSDGALPSDSGEAGSVSGGDASLIGRSGMACSGTGGGSGTGQGFGTGNGSGGALGGRGRGGPVAGSTWGSDSNPGEALAPIPKRMDRARYPVAAQKAGVQGRVVLNLEVLTDGRVGRIAIADSSGSGDLDRAARDAALRWTFEPAVADGHPIVAQIRIPIVFKLTDRQ